MVSGQIQPTYNALSNDHPASYLAITRCTELGMLDKEREKENGDGKSGERSKMWMAIKLTETQGTPDTNLFHH